MLKNEYLVTKTASIQMRTSPLKFDSVRSKIPDFTASDLSTKVAPAARSHSALLQVPTLDFRFT